MALDLQAILNEAVSEVLEKKEEETKESVEEAYSLAEKKMGEENKEELLEKVKKGVKHAYDATKEQLGNGYGRVKEEIGQHPLAAGIAAGATGALAAGAGALQLRKMIKKRGGLKK